MRYEIEVVETEVGVFLSIHGGTGGNSTELFSKKVASVDDALDHIANALKNKKKEV